MSIANNKSILNCICNDNVDNFVHEVMIFFDKIPHFQSIQLEWICHRAIYALQDLIVGEPYALSEFIAVIHDMSRFP